MLDMISVFLNSLRFVLQPNVKKSYVNLKRRGILLGWNISYISIKSTWSRLSFKYLLLFSCSIVSDTLQPHGQQHARLLVYHLLELAQTQVHWVGDAIQPSHPLLSSSLPTLKLSQHQGLFKWVSSSHKVAKILEFELQSQSFQWTPRTDFI